MGILRLPELEGYWKTLWVAEIPFFFQVMPRDCFELLFWMLHVSHSTGSLKRIDKVWLFVEKILSRFQMKYGSHSRASCWWEVSYQILGKQYMLKKPTKWGIKCFSLADLQWLHHQCSSLHWAWDTGQRQFPVPSSASTCKGYATPPEAIPWSRLACFHWPVLHQHPYDSDAKMWHYLHWNICEESSRSTQWNQRTTLTGKRSVGISGWGSIGTGLAYSKKSTACHNVSTDCSARSVVPARESDSEPQTKPIVVRTYNQQANGVDTTN